MWRRGKAVFPPARLRLFIYTTASGKWHQLMSLFLSMLCICLIFYVLIGINLEKKTIKARDDIGLIRRANVTGPVYFVNTPGCRLPHFHTFSDEIRKLISKPENYTCQKPLTRRSETEAAIIITMNATEARQYYNVSSQIRCVYRELNRSNFSHYENIEFKLLRNSILHIPPTYEYIYVDCRDKVTEKAFYTDLHFFVLDKQNSSDHGSYKMDKQTQRLSVMILGIDSLSHLNFLRQMPRTADFIHKYLDHVEFWGHNKVGDGTIPNMFSILRGIDAHEFIWRKFKRAGYQTIFAEELDYASFLEIFMAQATDYYFSAALMAKAKRWFHKAAKKCIGGRRSADVLLEYMHRLIPYMKTQDFFSYFWTFTLTHDNFNDPVLLDDSMLHTFELFLQAGIFNKTIIFFMSYHGIPMVKFRRTYQGLIEERQPLLFVLYPRWFGQEYAAATKNLKLNARRLTTHFDLHATLLDLLDVSNLSEENLKSRSEIINDPRSLPCGISLFLPIPITRTCEDAQLSTHLCICQQHEELSVDDASAKRAAQYLIGQINELLKPHPECQTLYLEAILRAIVFRPPPSLIRIGRDYFVDIMVRIVTMPNKALYASTVRMSDYNVRLTGGISRISKSYGNQSYCVYDRKLKKYCYC